MNELTDLSLLLRTEDLSNRNFYWGSREYSQYFYPSKIKIRFDDRKRAVRLSSGEQKAILESLSQSSPSFREVKVFGELAAVPKLFFGQSSVTSEMSGIGGVELARKNFSGTTNTEFKMVMIR